MVLDNHEVPSVIGRVETTCSIGYHQCVHSKELHHSHRHGDLVCVGVCVECMWVGGVWMCGGG